MTDPLEVENGFISYMRKIKVILCILLGTIFSCSFYNFFKYNPRKDTEIANILGIDSVAIVDFDYHEDWNFKDYDIIEVYLLSDVTINKFIMNSSLVLSDRYHESHLWEKINWCITPIDFAKWNNIYDMIFLPNRENPKYNKWLEEIRQTLKTPDNFYSFYYKDDGASVSFYTLNSKNKKLFCLFFKL